MNNFPTAQTSRHLSNLSRTAENLIYAANEAIANVRRTAALGTVDIPYDNVSSEEHGKFHQFIVAYGYRGGMVNRDNRTYYRITWE